jgi:uroporphyrinogen-III decarboxylase
MTWAPGPAFLSRKIFREFFKPYYQEMIDMAHRLGMHFWLHVCGNIEPFIPDLIEIGLDVLIPSKAHHGRARSPTGMEARSPYGPAWMCNRSSLKAG